MGFLDKAKAAAEQAAAKAKEGVEDVQTKRELGQAYGDLGKAAFELVESGELTHARLDPLVAKVRTLKERAEGAVPAGVGADVSGGSDPDEPAPPPAMPS